MSKDPLMDKALKGKFVQQCEDCGEHKATFAVDFDGCDLKICGICKHKFTNGAKIVNLEYTVTPYPSPEQRTDAFFEMYID